MNPDRDAIDEAMLAARAQSGLEITEAGWGYVVVAGDLGPRAAAARERVAGLAGLGCLALAGAQWLAPGVHALVGLAGQIGLSTLLTLAGAGLCLVFERGLLREVQVDLELRVLRGTQSNARGAVRIWREVGFDDIGSLFVRRAERPGVPARLCARVGESGSDLIEIARGSAAALSALQARLSRDMQGSGLRKVAPGRRPRGRRGLARPLPRVA